MPIDDRDDRRDNRQDRIAGYLTGDPHFPERSGQGPWSGVDVSGDAIYNLSRVVALCVLNEADLYLPGDIFDGPDPEPDAVADVYETLRPLVDSRLNVYYILGNHDRGRDWLKPLGSSVRRLDGRILESRLGTVTGLSFVHPDSFPTAVSKVRPTDVGLYHQTWSELTRHGNTSMRQLPKHRIAGCGDIHIKSMTQGASAATTISPGTLTPQSVTEFQGTSVFAMSTHLESWEVPLVTRRFLTFTVTTVEERDRLVSQLTQIEPTAGLPDHIARPFVSIRLSGDVATEESVTLLRSTPPERCVVRIDLCRTVTRNTKPTYAGTFIDDHASDAVLSAVSRAPISTAASDLCRAVLLTNDPTAVLVDSRLAAERNNACTSHPSV